MTVAGGVDTAGDAWVEKADLAMPLRLAGGVWGHLVGDAVGVPYEFRSPEAIGDVRFGARGNHGQPPGTWSDDGALMLALLDSLLVAGFNPEDQGKRALAWRREGAYAPGGTVFDIGGTTSEALRRLEQGTPAELAGPTGEHSQSNGSLMRILPLALWAAARPRIGLEELADLAARASKVTHGHPTCQVACAAYALTAALLLHSDSRATALETALETLRDHYRSSGPDDLAEALKRLEAWPTANVPAGRGGALNAFWSAWTAFAGAIDYGDTIERAVRYGNDTDTTAAIAGGLAGIYWRLDGIPAGWLAGMRGREIAEPIIDALIQAHGWKTSISKPIRVDWVDLAEVPGLTDAPGRLGMTFLPGKQYVGWHGEW
ncbi:MAG TPA: ADP-ribosylglycohydrolase family protein, partial [Candidatus Eisenbacteria bacterium]|nr:ADP-ribosylglycohydrolase family protein [Candidatus Eisenbacteria bacterium]